MSTETHTQVWSRGHTDALAGQCDESLYAQDTMEARLYRDGHRMGRREMNNVEHAGDTLIQGPERANTLMVDVVTPCVPVTDHKADPVATFAEGLDRQLKGMGEGPSAFSDPVPGKKPRRTKPEQPGQGALF